MGTFRVLARGSRGQELTDPDQFELRGDTMGAAIPLALLGPLIFGVPFLAAVFWVQRDLRRRRAGARAPVPWTVTNTVLLVALALALPVQFFLLRSGAPGTAADQAGVLITVGQWLALGLALRPMSRRSRAA